MKIREPIRLVIMYSDRLAIKRGRHSYISSTAYSIYFFFFSLFKERSAIAPDNVKPDTTFLSIKNCRLRLLIYA